MAQRPIRLLRLPPSVLERILNISSMKTRFELAACSKKSHKLIRSISLNLVEIRLHFDKNSVTLVILKSGNSETWEYTWLFYDDEDEGGEYPCIQLIISAPNEEPVETTWKGVTVLSFPSLVERVFQESNLRITRFKIIVEHHQHYENFSESFFALREGRQLKVAAIDVCLISLEYCVSRSLLNILKRLDPTELRIIYCAAGSDERMFDLTDVVRTEQWKKAKAIVMDASCGLPPVSTFQNCPRFFITDNFLKMSVILQLISHYQEMEDFVFTTICYKIDYSDEIAKILRESLNLESEQNAAGERLFEVTNGSYPLRVIVSRNGIKFERNASERPHFRRPPFILPLLPILCSRSSFPPTYLFNQTPCPLLKLPDLVLERVANFSLFSSRLALAECSRNFRYKIDSLPLNVTLLKLVFRKYDVQFSISKSDLPEEWEYEWSFPASHRASYVKQFRKSTYDSDVITRLIGRRLADLPLDLKQLLQAPLRIQLFRVEILDSEHYGDFIELFISACRQKLKVVTLDYSLRCSENIFSSALENILSRLDETSLRTIYFDVQNEGGRQEMSLAEIVGTEQWKAAKWITVLGNFILPPVSGFWDCPKLCIQVRILEPQIVLDLIRHYQELSDFIRTNINYKTDCSDKIADALESAFKIKMEKNEERNRFFTLKNGRFLLFIKISKNSLVVKRDLSIPWIENYERNEKSE